jgi:hypothetical protein
VHELLDRSQAVTQSEVVRDAPTDADIGGEVFRGCTEDELARELRQGGFRPTTQATCRSHLVIHVFAKFGDHHTRKITPGDRERAVPGFCGEECNPSGVLQCR